MKTCNFCKKDFIPKSPRNKNVFCSYQCYWNSKKGGEIYSCKQCNSRFKLENKKRTGDGAKRFCSLNCYWIYKKTDEYTMNNLQLAREKNKGNPAWNKGKKSPYDAWNKGKPNPKMMGEKNPNWRGGKGSERKIAMARIEYILWRSAVFMRDDYTCQTCGVRGGKLEADHIKPWALYPELRYAIDNGRTLCKPCHRQTDTWGLRAYNLSIKRGLD